MPRIDRDIKKRWLTFSLINFAIVVLLFGALLAGFAAYAFSAERGELEDAAEAYAASLAALGGEHLRAVCQGDRAYISSDPAFMFALYEVRADGSVGMSSPYDFVLSELPALGGRAGEVRTERVGGHEFVTYTAEVAAGLYVKVFGACDALVRAEDAVSIAAVPFSIAFVLIAAVASLVWGYTAIKPIMAGYVKQKNFIDDMSHEIRTPLAVIKGNLENILAAPDSKVEEVADMLEASLREVDYMNDMSTGLLSIVRGQSKLAAHGSAVVSEVVSEVVDMFTDMAAVGGKALVANIEHCDMPADREKIKQLLSVLLENSMKYTSEGDRITVRLRNSKDGCVLTVTDTGIGVPKADLERIFDRFYRAENAKDTPGTGLGLPIAQAIAEGMGGSIKAVQNIPSGLEMVVHLKRGGAKTRSSSDET